MCVRQHNEVACYWAERTSDGGTYVQHPRLRGWAHPISVLDFTKSEVVGWGEKRSGGVGRGVRTDALMVSVNETATWLKDTNPKITVAPRMMPTSTIFL